MTQLQRPADPLDAAQSYPPAVTASTPSGRPIFAWLGLIALILSAVLGSNAFSVRDRLFGSAIPAPAAPVASRDAFATVQQGARTPTTLRSQAWWQDVTTLSGAGAGAVTPFTIGDDAIQWRLKGDCRSGRLVVRAPGRRKPIIDAACAQDMVGLTSGTGAMRLQVQADGPWRLAVSQQIDAPLVEPPLKAMTAPGARKVAAGSFYKIDKTGKGTVTIFRQADGRYSLRLDRFFVSPTSDLEVRLSTRRAPRTSPQYISSRSELVSRMDVTAGSLNYLVPAGIDPTQFESVVIWCAATASAYAAASLRGT